MLELAEREEGIIVSNDQYRDLMQEKYSWRKIIEERYEDDRWSTEITVNQLLFMCEKYSRGSREPLHRKYFSPGIRLCCMDVPVMIFKV